MKRVKIALEDILVVLEAMQANGTKDIIVFDNDGTPAIADAEEPENMVTFQTFDDEINDADAVH